MHICLHPLRILFHFLITTLPVVLGFFSNLARERGGYNLPPQGLFRIIAHAADRHFLATIDTPITHCRNLCLLFAVKCWNYL